MNETIKYNFIKTLAMDETLRKSRAMITYASDRIRFVPLKGRKTKFGVNKTYAAQLFPKGRQHKQSSDR